MYLKAEEYSDNLKFRSKKANIKDAINTISLMTPFIL